MTPEVESELTKLRTTLATVGLDLRTRPGATEAQLLEFERKLGVRFDDDLRSLWKFSNGADGQDWFAVHSDEVTGCAFASIERSMEAWEWFAPYDQAIYDEWRNERSADSRIRQGMLHHRLWIPIAEFNGFSTAVYFDADPAPTGNYGQIIVYQHDPDAVYYVGSGFLEFFRRSNQTLAEKLTEIFFLGDEFERIVRMNGLGELERQLRSGLNPDTPNWRGRTLSEHAAEEGRGDIVDYLRRKS